MELLKEIKDRGYPAEYLLARIHGRRLSLIKDWDSLLSGRDISEYPGPPAHNKPFLMRTQDSAWRQYLKEREWIYHQMNSRLRNIFSPYFMYTELNTLLVCLRYKSSDGSGTDIERILQFSLMSDKLRGLLRAGPDVPAVLDKLGRTDAFMQNNSSGLEQVFLKDGFRGLEQGLADSLFKYIISMDMHPVIREFFAFIADARNIITLQRYMKWDTTTPPFFIRGGNIKETILTDILRSFNTGSLAALVYRQTGSHIEGPDAARVDNALQRRLTVKIKKWERESPDTGLILSYLWRCAMEAKNLSIIYHGREIDRNTLGEEIVH